MKPLTSSQTSRTAATPGSSSGSMPPPGTIHRSGWRLLLTSSTCGEQSTADGAPPALPFRAQLKGRDCLCASHTPRRDPPKVRPCQYSLFPQPHPDSRGNSVSTDTKALPHSVLLRPLPLPALTHCRKSCPCTPKGLFAPDTASLIV